MDFDASMIDFSSFMDVVGLDFQLDHTGVVLNSSLDDTALSTTMPIDSRTLLYPSPMDSEPAQTAITTVNHTEGNQSSSLSPHALNIFDHDCVESCSWEIHSRWRVSQSQWNDLNASLQPFRGHLDQLGFVLPSRITLSRYLAGFAEGHTHHHPFIHVPTLDIGNFHGTPDLTLAIAAVGAQYRYERSTAIRLYRAARSVAMVRLQSNSSLKAQAELDSTHSVSGRRGRHMLNSQMSGSVKSMLLLTTFASWQEDRTLVLESLSSQSILANIVRDKGLSETSPSDSEDWA